MAEQSLAKRVGLSERGFLQAVIVTGLFLVVIVTLLTQHDVELLKWLLGGSATLGVATFAVPWFMDVMD